MEEHLGAAVNFSGSSAQGQFINPFGFDDAGNVFIVATMLTNIYDG